MSSDSPPFFDANDALEVTPQTPADIAGDEIFDNLQTSKNPYRHALAGPSSDPQLPRSASQDTQSSDVSRTRPVRAVFYDLPTAHSSITSGTARSKQRASSNPLSDAFEEEDSIPLQELKPSKRKINPTSSPSFFRELPLPPPPAAAVGHRLSRHSSASDFSLAAENDNYASYQQIRQDKGKQRAIPSRESSVYHISLGAPASLSLSSGIDKASRNDGRSRNHTHETYAASLPFPDHGSTPVTHYTSPPMPRRSTKTNRDYSNAASSLPEGSTVGNIYRHYARSEMFDDIGSAVEGTSSEYDVGGGYPLPQNSGNHGPDPGSSANPLSDDGMQRSALSVRQERRPKQLNSGSRPPSSSLPSLPGPSSRLLPSSSQGVGPSSSYGDTQNLLEITERSPEAEDRTDGRSDELHGREVSETDNSPQRTPPPNANHPLESNDGPRFDVSKANEEDGEDDDYRPYVDNSDQQRQPLEREVSEALRRASNFSAYSDGSIATSVVDNFGYFHSEAASSNEIGTTSENAELSEAEADEDAQTNAFYDRDAIPAIWTSDIQHNMVRVPIQRHNRFPNPQPVSVSEDDIDSEMGESDFGDEANDWETVGESRFGGSVNMLGEGVAHRTGSSIANTSDAGTMSTYIPEISEYGSTERIAQHPGNIEYSGDYRQRDLKKTNIPIFLPIYGEHKVNGYLADSNRLRAPTSAFNSNPQPLKREHTHPFNSPPPKIAAKPSGARFSSRQRGAVKPNHFPVPASIKTDWSDEENDIGAHPTGPTRLNRPGVVAENFSRPFKAGWIDEFENSVPGMNTNGENRGFLKPIPRVTEPADRPSSWDHILAFANGDGVEGYNADGTRIADAPLEGGTLTEQSFSGHPLAAVTADGSMEQNTYGGKRSPNRKERSTLVKGPPGAFYSGLTKADRFQSATDRPRKPKPSYRRSNTNEPSGLRTFSLVKRHDRPVTPSMEDLMDIGPDPSLSSRPNDFVYRSPLAPPKRETWQALYTKEQLTQFEEAARANGISGSGEFRTIDLNDGVMESGHSLNRGGSSRHLGEPPRLWGGQKRQRVGNPFFQSPDRFQTEMPTRKMKISVIVLCLCNVVFPSLLLYHSGHLDWLMLWLTTAEFYSMGRPQKAYALWCFIGWCVALFFGLVGFLIYWFAIR
ncbi:hypothetical protein D0Z07_0937 [Hyphodiscus hymeniophilus]|uniref:Uncharacterized protein n=1 Tax=Hyphodiscus hymeniophilus TaxID=353542 RepID=A0A9P6VR75_9HELO|nr:hypothetical protein D0Z07_0937 [Hyphodiscus hymeniophilus]